MAPYDATVSGFPGATLFPELFSVASVETVVVPDEILDYEASLVPEDWFDADGDSVIEYHEWLEANAFCGDELGQILEAQQELQVLEYARDNDPYHPWNQSFFRHCLLTGNTLFQRVVLVGALWVMTVLVSPEDEAVARAIRWHVGRCGETHRYPRNGKLYLHRLVMMRMLRDDADLRARMLRKFGVTPSRASHPGAAIDSDVDRLMVVGIVHHRNHDTADCRRENLELVDAAANMRQAQQKPGASGYVGVRRRSGKGHWKFEALVERHDRGRDWSVRLGVYPLPELAALARALFLLAHPRYLTSAYTPTAREASVWAMAKAFLEGAEEVGSLWLSDVLQHPTLLQLLDYARQQASKGRAVVVRERDGGH